MDAIYVVQAPVYNWDEGTCILGHFRSKEGAMRAVYDHWDSITDDYHPVQPHEVCGEIRFTQSDADFDDEDAEDIHSCEYVIRQIEVRE